MTATGRRDYEGSDQQVQLLDSTALLRSVTVLNSVGLQDKGLVTLWILTRGIDHLTPAV